MSGASLVARLAALNTALICDALDAMGGPTPFLGTPVRPLRSDMQVAGTAFTMRCEPMDAPPARPYQHLLAAYGDMPAGSVVVLACGDDYSAMWGELLSAAARGRGAVGAVMDGAVRDVDQILDMGFPVFAAGYSPLDSAGRQEVVEHGVTVRCGDADVAPGDLVLGDVMGVVVIPAAMAAEAIRRAEEKLAGERTARADLERGDDIRDVFDRYGLL